MRGWPRWLSLAISLIPVAALMLIVITTFIQSLPALQQIGVTRMLGTDLAAHMTRTPRVQYGMLTPIWGTLVIGLLAMLIALPTSVAFAVIAREFRVPVLSRAIGAVVGVLGGIPPIIYALVAVFFNEAFLRPKLAAWDVIDEHVKATLQGLPQYSQVRLPTGVPNSTALGGLLVALLIIPFMTPLIDDAFRSVPLELKQGSYALGATRWQTLWQIVIPYALPGIFTAIALGTLVGMGEVLIPSSAVGGAENVVAFPQPFWNLLARTPTLSSAAASLAGASSEAENINPLQLSMAYMSSLVLLGFAFLVMAAETLAQRYMRTNRA